MKYILLCTIVLLFFGCKKNELDALPEATQTGANTFGCLIDGKLYIPNGGGAWSGVNAVEGRFIRIDPGDGHIWIETVSQDGSGMDIWLRNTKTIGEYLLAYDTYIKPDVILPKSYGYHYTKKENYITTPQYTGKVIITRSDTLAGIISGTFEFTAYNPATRKTINITNGRFNVGPRKR